MKIVRCKADSGLFRGSSTLVASLAGLKGMKMAIWNFYNRQLNAYSPTWEWDRTSFYFFFQDLLVCLCWKLLALYIKRKTDFMRTKWTESVKAALNLSPLAPTIISTISSKKCSHFVSLAQSQSHGWFCRVCVCGCALLLYTEHNISPMSKPPPHPREPLASWSRAGNTLY